MFAARNDDSLAQAISMKRVNCKKPPQFGQSCRRPTSMHQKWWVFPEALLNLPELWWFLTVYSREEDAHGRRSVFDIGVACFDSKCLDVRKKKTMNHGSFLFLRGNDGFLCDFFTQWFFSFLLQLLRCNLLRVSILVWF